MITTPQDVYVTKYTTDVSQFKGLDWSIVKSREATLATAVDLRGWKVKGEVPGENQADFFVKYIQRYHRFVENNDFKGLVE